ncbi:MAG: ABC transporter ATP-binding protein [gamma proteobacterium symbiont of Lucinoma myriamae]|nr:ABC transporter ATP-binding protein [gamma proteobacterium symbiont of Lucinoma myriamae]MCU7819020.1 ABC transporter ATP-binding protein [gamma proteobacterium symbiont of Lucinoma myriamae]MCU7832881.1 ABC transporter ATP-binding protein [gamma proteobacterium symbiont of Lucinoma myriamae]
MLYAQHLAKNIITPNARLDILRDVNFHLRAGETMAITGASGSGKSTLLSLLAGLDTPSSGQVKIAGYSLSELDEEARALLRQNKIGFVFQSFHLIPALNALDNVMLPLELKGQKNAQEQALDLLARVGLSQRSDHKPVELSGGEQQRVAIARAFAGHPEILFADEPTGNLDQLSGETIIKLLFELNQEQGTTLVLVTHDQLLAQACQRHFYLDQGVLNELSADDLTNSLGC